MSDDTDVLEGESVSNAYDDAEQFLKDMTTTAATPCGRRMLTHMLSRMGVGEFAYDDDKYRKLQNFGLSTIKALSLGDRNTAAGMLVDLFLPIPQKGND